MPDIDVVVNGRSYKMACDTGEEDHLRELAAFVDNEVELLRTQFGEVGDNRLLVMASLMVADKLSEAVRRIESAQSEVEGLKDARTAALERTRGIEEDVAEKLEQAAARIEEVSDEISGATN